MLRGEIVEVGGHEELLRREDGLYARLWALQSDHMRTPGMKRTRRAAGCAPRLGLHGRFRSRFQGATGEFLPARARKSSKRPPLPCRLP